MILLLFQTIRQISGQGFGVEPRATWRLFLGGGGVEGPTKPEAVDHGVAIVKAKVVDPYQVQRLPVQANDLTIAGGEGARRLDGAAALRRRWRRGGLRHRAGVAVEAGSGGDPRAVLHLQIAVAGGQRVVKESSNRAPVQSIKTYNSGDGWGGGS